MSVFVAAEIGVAWNGQRERIPAFMQAAKDAGASAVKLQAFNAAKLIERRGIAPDTMLQDKWNVCDLLRRCELTDADLDMIAVESQRIGLPHFYSVFDPSQIERVLSRGACALKIGHAESGWTELASACSQQKPEAMKVYVSNEDWPLRGFVGVHCVEEYPATSRPELGSIHHSSLYQGFSSHYTDYRIPAAAALRGAEYVEAHMKLSAADPEAAWSLSVEDFGKMVKLIREYSAWL